MFLGAIAVLSMMPPAIAQPCASFSQMSVDDYYERGLAQYIQRDWEGAVVNPIKKFLTHRELQRMINL